MKNLKRAYYLYHELKYERPFDKQQILTVEFAELLGIKFSREKALDPRNAESLRRQKFWSKLRATATYVLQDEVSRALQESSQLYIGLVLFPEDDPQKVVKIRSGGGVTCKNDSGLCTGRWNILNLPFDFENLPGENDSDPEFWKQNLNHIHLIARQRRETRQST